MNETRLHTAFRIVCNDLSSSGAAFAIVGGLAVSARTEPRFTKDLDLAVSVEGDAEAEGLVEFLQGRGYAIQAVVEQEIAARLATTVRLVPPGERPITVDLLFASSGIEREIVAAAEPLEIIEDMVVRVATMAHLIAAKILSRDDEHRPQDRVDLIALLREAREDDIAEARKAIRLIESRGFNRGRDLAADLDVLLEDRRATRQ